MTNLKENNKQNNLQRFCIIDICLPICSAHIKCPIIPYAITYLDMGIT